MTAFGTRRGPLVAAVALVVLAAACGSTASVPRGQAQRGGEAGLDARVGGDGFAAGTDVDGDGDIDTTTADGVVAADGTRRTGGGPSATSPRATTVGGGIAAGGPAAPGVTAKEVYVGLVYDINAGAANEAAGVGAITSGDSKANSLAIVDDINKNGGVGGRKLVPVFAELDQTSPRTFDQQYASACEKFTNDNPKVFAVEGSGTDSFRQCISKAGVTMLGAGLPEMGQAEFDRYPALIEQGYPNVDRLAAHYVTPLTEQSYFTPWNTVSGQPAPTGKAKVGVLTYDDRHFSNAVNKFLVPALRRLGYDPQVIRIAQNTTASDLASQGAAVQSAQLAFASNRVTHVIPFEANGGLSTLFLPVARSQGYYPRYGVSTASGFQALIDAGVPTEQQLNGTVGFGWLPAVDLAAVLNPPDGPYSNANRRYCLEVMRRNGIVFDSGNAENIALNTCATLYLLKTALDRIGGGTVTRAGFVQTIEGLGATYQRAGGIGQEFRPGRRDPSNAAYHWRYFADCKCMRYVGALRPVA